MDGILVPQGGCTGEAVLLGQIHQHYRIPLTVSGTRLGGLLPALFGWLPGRLASAIR